MTEKDKQLIQEAYATNSIDYYLIDDLIDKADTDQAKERLHFIQIRKRLLEQKEANGYV